MTLKLWADQRTDAAKSCCSPLAVLGARELAHQLGIPHLTLDLEHELSRRGRRRVRRRLPRRANPEPVRDLQRRAAHRRDARARRPRRRARPRDRPLRADRPTTARARCSAPPRIRPRTRPTCSPGLRPGSLARLRFPLAELSKPEVREQRRRRRARGGEQGREPGPVLSRRRGQALVSRAPWRPRRAPWRHRRRRRPAPGRARRPARLHRWPAPRPRSRLPRSRCYVLATDAELEPGHGRLARGARDRPRPRSRRDPASRRAGGSTAFACATTPARSPASCRRSPPASTTSSSSSWPSRPTVSRRAKPRACSTATSSSAARRSPESDGPIGATSAGVDSTLPRGIAGSGAEPVAAGRSLRGPTRFGDAQALPRVVVEPALERRLGVVGGEPEPDPATGAIAG